MNADVGGSIVRRYDEALLRHGDSAQGANWPNEADRVTRYRIMLELMRLPFPENPVFCDLACGTGDFYNYLKRTGHEHIHYIGVDRSNKAISLAR